MAAIRDCWIWLGEIIASQTGQLAQFKDVLSEQYAVSA